MNFRVLFIALTFAKVLIFAYFSLFPTVFFGGGNDSEYYDAYAQGEDSDIPNIWPLLLRALSDLGMYSREGVKYFLAFLGILVIPLLVGRLAVVTDAPFRNRTFWLAALVVAIYPTLFFYTFDIYRDVFMVFIFLMGLLAIKAFIQAQTLIERIAFLCCIFAFGIFLYFLRPYLGFGFLAAFFSFGVFNFKTASLKLYLMLFLVLLNLFFLLGFFEPILMYRETFDDILGESNIGIQFKSSEMFIPTFVLSFVYQILGFHFVNYASVFVFALESLPFAVVLVYLFKNRLLSNPFVSYLVIFFVLYSTVWLLGNDNLGTAVRLRMYSYIAIFIALMIVLQRKSLLRKLNAEG